MTGVLEQGEASSVRLSPWDIGSRNGPRRRRLLVGIGVAFALVSLVFGFPTGREVITWSLDELLWDRAYWADRFGSNPLADHTDPEAHPFNPRP